ncbi:MAG: HTH domain-containing protein [Culicoidibacterales bacterium]
MSKIVKKRTRFTREQITELEKNPNVERVSKKAITYAKEFKVKVVHDITNGMKVRDSFIKHGFDLELIGENRMYVASGRWLNRYNQFGAEGLIDMRKFNKQPRAYNPGKRKLYEASCCLREYDRKLKNAAENVEHIE